MKTSSPTRRRTTWPVADLKPHPLQEKYFSDLPGASIKELAGDISHNGLREPLEITPAGVIISGHQRLQAVKLLRWKTVGVVVRHDLAAQGEKAIECRLIEANLNRRHLSKLELARIYKRYKAMFGGKKGVKGGGDLRDQIGEKIGLSGRQLERLLPLLELPREIQQVVEEKKLPAKRALELLEMDTEIVAQVVAAIQDGHDFRKLISRARAMLPSVNDSAPAEYTDKQLVQSLKTLIANGFRLKAVGEKVPRFICHSQYAQLKQVGEFLLNLAAAGSNKKRNDKEVKPKQKLRLKTQMLNSKPAINQPV